ncbi:MAG TPA: DUF1800 domain-containing protein [Solirubrobacteraceae bacterium]|jgi:hypothetical protein|nr:DUF1800 domain-containing protein [Solirubrobacteraceae bacterium]
MDTASSAAADHGAKHAHHSGHAHHGHHKKRHHLHKRHHKKHRRRHHHRHHGTAVPPLPVAPANPPAPSGAPVPTAPPTLTLQGARRLLWRAGFGPAPGQAEALAGQPIQQVVYSLTRPSGAAVLSGPEPVNDEGHPLDPVNAYDEDHCWWLDRMIRSNQPLVERMTLLWHDWFANSNEQVNSQKMMLEQNELFRSMCLGSFHDLFRAVTVNPAMLVFLNGIYNSKENPNENYGREMMELFSLGADRGAYTETDIREMARALTGWTAEWSAELGQHNFHFEPELHDEEEKTVFGHKGNWNWEDAVNLCVGHPLHPSFFVTKLWGYFIPSAPDEATLASLQGLYLSSGFSIRAVVEAILQHPDFYAGPELVTPPVVYDAGLMRAVGRYVDTTAWTWLCDNAGQRLFYPPNVSGWDYSRWLDTSTTAARWEIANYVTAKSYVNPWPEGGSTYEATEDGPTALQRAMSYWANPTLSEESLGLITGFANAVLDGHTAKWEQSPYRAIRQNALRMLIATSPDMQVS